MHHTTSAQAKLDGIEMSYLFPASRAIVYAVRIFIQAPITQEGTRALSSLLSSISS